MTAGMYVIETEGPTDVVMSLFGPTSQTTLITQDDDCGPDLNSRIAVDLPGGHLFARVRHFNSTGTGVYSITVRR